MANDIINQRGGAFMQSDPLRNFRFLVEFRPYWNNNQAPDMGKIKFGFTSVSGLSVATEAIPYREGGMNTTLHQLPGQTTFSPITLSRGVHLGNKEAWQWMKRLFSVTGGSGVRSTGRDFNFRSAVEIYVLQHPTKRANDDNIRAGSNAQAGSYNDPVGLGFKVYNAWIQSLAYSDMNAGDNAVMVEQIVLAHEGFDMRWPDVDTKRTVGNAQSWWSFNSGDNK
jgi:phage tail-like protein